jgi:hypothetical protein
MHDIAFNTQPGHIPARARIIAQQEKAFEHGNMAAHHEQRAAGIEAALERSIYSDDDNAIEALEKRIAEHEAERERMVKVNKLWRKKDAAGLAALGISLETLNKNLQAAGYFGKQPHMPYEMSNLGGRIQADKKRLLAIKARQKESAEAAAAPGGVLIKTGDFHSGSKWANVTFAEKPDRAILNELKDAGFRWSSGSWFGDLDKLPESVKALQGAEPC